VNTKKLNSIAALLLAGNTSGSAVLAADTGNQTLGGNSLVEDIFHLHCPSGTDKVTANVWDLNTENPDNVNARMSLFLVRFPPPDCGNDPTCPVAMRIDNNPAAGKGEGDGTPPLPADGPSSNALRPDGPGHYYAIFFKTAGGNRASGSENYKGSVVCRRANETSIPPVGALERTQNENPP